MNVDQIKAIYQDLEGLSIDLPRDAAGLGPEYLREKISLCRNYLNTVSYHLQKVLQEMHSLDLELAGRETSFKVSSDELLANDRRVTTLPAIEDRLAMINVLLADEARAIQSLQREIKNNKGVEKVLRFRKGELDNTMSALRLQRSLLKDQLRTGAFYGDESQQSRNEDPVEGMSSEDWASLIDETEAVHAGGSGSAVQFPEETDDDEVEDATPIVVVSEPTFEEELAEEDPPYVAPDSEKSKAPPVTSVKKSEDAALLEELEALLEADVDVSALPVTSPAETKVQEDLPKPNPTNPLHEDDVDLDIQNFLAESNDDIDSLLADI